MKHKIWMEALPQNTNGAPPIPGGWFGPVAGVGMNFPIYCRVTDEAKAYQLEKWSAIHRILEYRDKGYPCFAVPPIEVVF